MRLLALVAFLGTLFVSFPVLAQTTACPSGHVCVPPEDMKVFVRLLQEQKCRTETTPTFRLDPINLVVDRDGRVYGSGADPHPYTLAMSWCNYDVTAKGSVKLVAARREPPEFGFRFRLKAGMGPLVSDLFTRGWNLDAVDVGLLWELGFYREVNLNLVTGFRSAGVVLGFDLTRNVGLYFGYGLAYAGPRHNPTTGLSFAFWLRPWCKRGRWPRPPPRPRTPSMST